MDECKPLCVGRLGAEKNLYALKEILLGCPEGTSLALIGDGPERPGQGLTFVHFSAQPEPFLTQNIP